MAVLCEGISVIVRRDAIERHLENGWSEFHELVPNSTLCSDDKLARVGFMEPGSVEAFVNVLERLGLKLFQDIAVVDQIGGPTRECDWLEFARFPIGKNETDKVAMCWLFDGERIMGAGIYINSDANALHTPPGWRYEGSLSQQFTYVPTEDLEDRLEYLRSEGDLDVYRNRDTGKEMYVGKTDRLMTKTIN